MNEAEARKFMGVSDDISKDDLKSKYRSLVKQYHPDVSKYKNSEELIKKLNKAYELLSCIEPKLYKPKPSNTAKPSAPKPEFSGWKRSISGNLYRVSKSVRFIIIKNKFDNNKYDYMTVASNGDKKFFFPSYASEKEVQYFIDSLIKIGGA